MCCTHLHRLVCKEAVCPEKDVPPSSSRVCRDISLPERCLKGAGSERAASSGSEERIFGQTTKRPPGERGFLRDNRLPAPSLCCVRTAQSP